MDTENILNLIDTRIFKLNWESRQQLYESRNFNFNPDQISAQTGIIIDNGSYECRAGWSICEEPNLIFKNVVAKPKVQSKHSAVEFLVGKDISSIEQGKLHKKSPFDKNFIAHFGAQEHILDHIFSNLSKYNLLYIY
jgi:actin-related protein